MAKDSKGNYIAPFAGEATTRGRLCTRESIDYTFSPSTGEGYRETYIGTPQAILGLYESYKRAGFEAELKSGGGAWRLYITFGAAETNRTQIPTDKWEIDYEWPQVSVWSHPAAAKEADGYIDRAQYRKDIEDTVKDGEACTFDPIAYPYAHKLHRWLSRGIEAHEVRRPILKRSRTYSLGYGGQRATLTSSEPVYTTGALAAHFGIDSRVLAQLPADPGPSETPAFTIWGWRLRRDSSEIIPFVNKVQESKDWTYAAWDTDLYNIVTS